MPLLLPPPLPLLLVAGRGELLSTPQLLWTVIAEDLGLKKTDDCQWLHKFLEDKTEAMSDCSASATFTWQIQVTKILSVTCLPATQSCLPFYLLPYQKLIVK